MIKYVDDLEKPIRLIKMMKWRSFHIRSNSIMEKLEYSWVAQYNEWIINFDRKYFVTTKTKEMVM